MDALPERLVPLAADPSRSGLCLDFDGTLAAIVADPAMARPLPGVPGLLAALAAHVAVVAVISGRPVQFLRDVLGSPPGVRLVGLYGLEWHGPGPDGGTAPGAEAWRRVIADVAGRAERHAPPGVHVEPKGLTVTLHWRHAPDQQEWVEGFAARAVVAHELVQHASRMSIELGPPLAVDKGTVVRGLAGGLAAVAAFGDDVGDLPAFAALAALASDGVQVCRVAAVDDESPPEVAAAADVLVDGAPGAVALLQQLLAAMG